MKRVLILDENSESESQAGSYILVYRDTSCPPIEEEHRKKDAIPCAVRILYDLRGCDLRQGLSLLLAALTAAQDISRDMEEADTEMKETFRKARYVLQGVDEGLKHAAGLSGEVIKDDR